MGEIVFFAKPLNREDLSEILSTGFRYGDLVEGRLPLEPQLDGHDLLSQQLRSSTIGQQERNAYESTAASVDETITRGLIEDIGTTSETVPAMNVPAKACAYPLTGEACFPIKNVTLSSDSSSGPTAYYALLKDVALNTTGSEVGQMRFDGQDSNFAARSAYFERDTFPRWENASMALMLWLKVDTVGAILTKYRHHDDASDVRVLCWTVQVEGGSLLFRYVTSFGSTRSVYIPLPQIVFDASGPTPFVAMAHWRCAALIEPVDAARAQPHALAAVSH